MYSAAPAPLQNAARLDELDVSLVPPPYLAFEPLRDPRRATRASMPAGTLVALRVQCPRTSWEALARDVLWVRGAFCFAPVILRLDPGWELDRLVSLARCAGTLGVRGVVVSDQRLLDTLRATLPRPVALGPDVREWLAARDPRCSPRVRDLIGHIFAVAPECSELKDLLAPMALPVSTARAQCQKKGLPAPGAWLRVARALHAALRLQADPTASVERVAFELGYADHSALSRQMRDCFGLRPSAARKILGWEWLLDEWLRQQSLS